MFRFSYGCLFEPCSLAQKVNVCGLTYDFSTAYEFYLHDVNT